MENNDNARKATEALGVTFNGSVTFNGPMFDIHDNQHVHIGMTENKEPRAPRAQAAVPAVLQAPEARALRERLAAAALLAPDGWQPASLTGPEKGQMAVLIAERLGIRDVWQTFGPLWGMSAGTLRTYYNTALDQRKYGSFQEKLKNALD